MLNVKCHAEIILPKSSVALQIFFHQEHTSFKYLSFITYSLSSGSCNLFFCKKTKNKHVKDNQHLNFILPVKRNLRNVDGIQ